MEPQIVAHGIDLVRIDRIARLWREHGAAFVERIFTSAERAYCLGGKNAAERLAGRFAAKEAVLKMLRTGWRGNLRWTDIETLPGTLGRPVLILHRAAAELARAQRITRVLISISHTREHALASVIGVGGEGDADFMFDRAI